MVSASCARKKSINCPTRIGFIPRCTSEMNMARTCRTSRSSVIKHRLLLRGCELYPRLAREGTFGVEKVGKPPAIGGSMDPRLQCHDARIALFDARGKGGVICGRREQDIQHLLPQPGAVV